MRRTRLAAALFIVLLLAGCGAAGNSGESGSQSDKPTRLPVDPPNALLASDPVVAEAARSVARIRSVAQSCQRLLEGSGVVVSPNRVMSAAHTVAGSDSVTVSVGDEERPATVVSFDPKMDIAILDVPELQAPPLELTHEKAPTGADAVVLGFPGGGPFTASPARIREVVELKGPDIYRTTSVNREVYVIRGKVGQGNSGGPLIDLQGRVLGISFGAAVDDPETGFALTATQVYGLLVIGTDATQPVPTEGCVS
jgi:S1-C subfamily serine protease